MKLIFEKKKELEAFNNIDNRSLRKALNHASHPVHVKSTKEQTVLEFLGVEEESMNKEFLEQSRQKVASGIYKKGYEDWASALERADAIKDYLEHYELIEK